ncbi:hypothetical protein [Thalassospira sp.]|uniref:hypothetical protein n=1 Tax=Thalassospira sp. TaxID=1912094 RepID=UPI00273533DC|nr:hypothetical protein [Thalassospira sp.]MDP2697304.1 hypothetical protein [Thalassospira sp.]
MLSIKCEHRIKYPNGGYGNVTSVVTYSVASIVHSELVIGGIPGATISPCKSIAMAQAIAAFTIMEAITDAADKLDNNPDAIRTAAEFGCFTKRVDQKNAFVIVNYAELGGTVEVQTNGHGTINLGLANIDIPGDRLNDAPDTILIDEVRTRLRSAISEITLECRPLQDFIEGREIEVRKIAVKTRLPKTLLDRVN